MNKLDKVNKILKKCPYSLSCSEKDNIVFLTGEVNTYQEKITIGLKIAKLKIFEHVVNDIKVKGLIIPKTRYNQAINTNEFNELPCDVLVIGGGVIGCAILRELSRYKIKAILLEKEEDVAMHASSRNDGNIHPGIDLNPNTLKLKYLKEAHRLWPTYAQELGIKYIKTGQVLTFKKNRFVFNIYAYIKSKTNDVEHISYLNKKEFLLVEPNVSNDLKGAVVFNDAAQVSPYELTIALAENAIINGAEVYLNTIVKDMVVENNEIKLVKTNRGTIKPKLVINAAGVFSEDIAIMANDHFFSIHPRKGTDIILDKKVFTKTAKHTIGLKSIADARSNTKGGGFVVTVDNNVLVGPNAYEVPDKEDFSTEKDSIITVLNKQKELFSNVSTKDIITYFSGLRACTYEEDFVIQNGKWTKNIIHAAGIQSPGLSCAPSIAKEVAKLTINHLGDVQLNERFNPIRKEPVHLVDLSLETIDGLIKQNPNYGIIVCRCERVSKQEIIDALHRPLPVNSIDGIKRRVRAGMGRCQGGFCEPIILNIMAQEKNVSLLSIVKKGSKPILDRMSK